MQRVPWFSDEDLGRVLLAERRDTHVFLLALFLQIPVAILKDIPAHVADVTTDSQTPGFS